ncbi:hypothetical protein [Kiloniella majae]|uniref:hypothetical protein n=1 Tax=Kiloniella majae TaxID=1938558 RepID=UPI000A2796A2|nr:hypothetical protein [Kiloniella majae]
MIKQLTESIADVAELVGIDLAADLVRHFGGTRVYVPKVARDHQDLVQKLGREQADLLVSEFAEQELDVPMHLYDEARARRALIHKLCRKRWTKASIARAAGCTERYVYHVLGQEGGNDPALF